MKKKLFVLGMMSILVLALAGACAAEKLVFSDSFEDGTVGQPPAGWELVHPAAGVVVDAAAVSIADGKLALQLNNTASDMGEVTCGIPEITDGKMVVSFYQPNASRENINLEVFSENGRLVGVFVTGSGNVRIRDEGVQSDNMVNLPNDKWHTLVIKWDQELFKVYYLDANNIEIPITETAKLDPAGLGKPASSLLFNVSKRDDAKIAFIDNILVYDLAQ